jgi:pyruvate/2-oxoglutarate dehydrogenase complex dihydrolipoamide acyltransferase (E2) component
MHEPEAAPAMPDEVHIVLMIRNAVIALSQANITGNYTVVRELGTADFQMTNSPARLAEIFATLRSRKIDLSPVMVFSPKYTSGPALDGQVLRVAGYFPTSPEQVQFELAYQHAGDQWLLGGIAVSVAPPADGAQASAAPAGQLLQASAEPVPPSAAKPIRIDLNLPAGGAQVNGGAPKKPAAVKKPKPPAQKAAAAQAPAPAGEASAPAPAPAPQQAAPSEPTSGSGPSWNPFGR